MYTNILVPVVLGGDHDYMRSFQVARLLANDDANFTILYMREPIPGYLAAEIPEDVLATSERKFQDDLNQLAEELPNAKAKIVPGHAGRGILDFAKANEIDCIVIASHQPGIQHLIMGSTANKVVHDATCSVHVIRYAD